MHFRRSIDVRTVMGMRLHRRITVRLPVPVCIVEGRARKMSVTSATIMPVLTAALLATTFGCGSQRRPTEPSSLAPQPGPISQPASKIVPAASGGVPGVYRFDVVMSHSGTATVTLRWPDADYSLQLYVTSGACADTTSLVTGACMILGRTRPGDLPGVVTSPVNSGDLNTIWVLNTDPAPQSFMVDLGIQ